VSNLRRKARSFIAHVSWLITISALRHEIMPRQRCWVCTCCILVFSTHGSWQSLGYRENDIIMTKATSTDQMTTSAEYVKNGKRSQTPQICNNVPDAGTSLWDQCLSRVSQLPFLHILPSYASTSVTTSDGGSPHPSLHGSVSFRNHSRKDPFLIYILAILKIGFDYHVASLSSEPMFDLSTEIQYSGEIA